jgi:hypothetical protein
MGVIQACGGRELPTARTTGKKNMNNFKIKPRGMVTGVILNLLKLYRAKTRFS